MAKGEFLGEFEQLVMLALARLEPEAYGMRVRQEIEDRTGRSVAIGAVYATLERLETKKHVRSWVGEPTAERGGRAKKYFALTATGERSLAETQRVLRQMTAGLEAKWAKG